jgi:hypothetical protein
MARLKVFTLRQLLSPSLELLLQRTLMYDSIALDCQVAPEVVATAEIVRSGSNMRQDGDVTRNMDPQKQAAEAMHQTAKLATQVMDYAFLFMSPYSPSPCLEQVLA